MILRIKKKDVSVLSTIRKKQQELADLHLKSEVKPEPPVFKMNKLTGEKHYYYY